MTNDSKSSIPAPPKTWWSPKQIAAEFGVDERTVRHWIDRGDLKVHKFGGVLRISEEDREDFIRRGRRQRSG